MYETPKNYLLYSIKRWGIGKGLSMWWEFQASPQAISKSLKRKYKLWKLTDRRKKRNWSRKVYAANRDGDYYLIECPECHDQQRFYYVKENHNFECGCGVIFQVYLEDGLLEIEEHRDGNLLLPTKMVQDDMGHWHTGITVDAPWWWTRRDLYPDLQENGKDGHGHYEYKIVGRRQEQQLSGELNTFSEKENASVSDKS